MPVYKIVTQEVWTVEATYTVEAVSEEKAKDLVMCGHADFDKFTQVEQNPLSEFQCFLSVEEKTS